MSSTLRPSGSRVIPCFLKASITCVRCAEVRTATTSMLSRKVTECLKIVSSLPLREASSFQSAMLLRRFFRTVSPVTRPYLSPL